MNKHGNEQTNVPEERNKSMKLTNGIDAIDFVVPWVDSNDPEWQAEKEKYLVNSDAEGIDAREIRYRAWDIFKYWFRGVETFAPWVNKVYLITCGHIPSWLNLKAPKLVHVCHKDYMPIDYLPTFSSHPIELNIHRIKGLSEHIVYSNDDCFFLKPASPDLFFKKKGVPVYPARLHGISPNLNKTLMPHILINIVHIINSHFKMKESLRNNWGKWFSIKKNGWKAVIENIYCMQHSQFPGFYTFHLPVPFLKTTIDTIWQEEYQVLDATSKRRFRDIRDVNQYLFWYWQLASGQFEPIKASSLGRFHNVTSLDDVTSVCDDIKRQKYPIICINDFLNKVTDKDFRHLEHNIATAFECILPNKSSFEL